MLNKIKCFFGKHKYKIVEKLNSHTNKVGCKHCDKMWGMHHPTKSFVEWDDELASLYGKNGILKDL